MEWSGACANGNVKKSNHISGHIYIPSYYIISHMRDYFLLTVAGYNYIELK